MVYSYARTLIFGNFPVKQILYDMKPQELRVGNVVEVNHYEYGDMYASITSINDAGDLCLHLLDERFTKEEYECTMNEVYPIPITEERLLKIGFKKDVDANNLYRYAIDDCLFEIRLWNSGTLIKLENYYENCVRKIHLPKTPNLHQLQNAYYLVTGKELEINL